MQQKISLIKVIVVLLILGAALAAVAQRAGPSGTVVPVCVKGNGQLRMLTRDAATCRPPEQMMDWVVGGEVTDITLGRGLIGSREDGEVQLELDPSVIQSCGSCASGKVFAGFDDGPGSTPAGADAPTHGDPLPVIRFLPVPAGKYVVQAKLWVSNTLDARLFVRCKLSAGVDFDWVEVTVRECDSAALALTVVHEFDADNHVTVGCSDNALGSGTEWNDLKLIAIEAASLSNVFLGGS